jgi:alpha-L-fucosidase
MNRLRIAILTFITLSFLGCNSKVPQNNFEPTVESLQKYECPEWFRDAKFGIWVCWNAYAVPGVSNWYARNMYIQGHPTYNYHVENYGHPSEFGFKDIVDLWKGENFEPEELMKLFKSTGAKYFVAMANHHENFDLWDSKYQPWNSVNYGPKRDIIGEWRKATLKSGLRWGITSHAERTWSWMQVAKHADKTGPKVGVPYDGANPDYEQMYLPADPTGDYSGTQPKNATPWWRENWYNRCADLIDNYKPDLFYVDGGVPFPGEDKGRTGLKMMAHLYNQNASWHGGDNEAVMCIKNWLHIAPDGGWGHYWDGIGTRDYERDRSEEIRKEPWQTDTSIGHWFWNRNEQYRSSTNVIHELVDIVSKNGNLLLNVPLRADGTLDDEAVEIMKGIAEWMDINSESIYATRYWQIPGIGNLRIVQKDGDLYITTFEWPEDGIVNIPFLLTQQKGVILKDISLLGYEGELSYQETKDGVEISLPTEKPCKSAWVFKVKGKNFDKIDLSQADLKREVQKNMEAIKVWKSVSKLSEIGSDYTAVAANELDQHWAINTKGNVVLLADDKESVLKQKAIDIDCSIEGTIAIVTPEGDLKKRNKSGWELVESPKKVKRVAVSPEGNMAVIYQDETIGKYNGEWHLLEGSGSDIAYGPDGFLAHIGSENGLYVSNGNKWSSAGGALERISISPKTGHCLGVNKNGEVWVWKNGAWFDLSLKAKDVTCDKSDDDEIITIIK